MKIQKSKIIVMFSIAITAFLLSAISYYFLYSEVDKIRSETSTIADDLKKQKIKNEELDTIKKNIGSTIADHDKLLSLFVNHENVVDFIQYIENLAKSSGISVSIETVETKDSDSLSPVGKELLYITLKTSGSWQNTMQFLSSLEKIPYKISINTISFDLRGSNNLVKEGEDKDLLRSSGLPVWNSSINFDVVKIKQSN